MPASPTEFELRKKAFTAALVAAAKPHGWQHAYGSLIADKGGGFVAVVTAPVPKSSTIMVLSKIKPMAIDPIFWDVMGTPKSWTRALSRRDGGPSLRPPSERFECSDSTGAEAAAAEIVAAANDAAAKAQRWSLSDFITLCRAEGPDRYIACILTALIADDRVDEAVSTARSARDEGKSGGFRAQGKGFVELFLDRYDA